MLWYVHTSFVAYEHKSQARNLKHHIMLFLIFFFVSSEGGGALNELILGMKNSFIGNNFKFAAALSIWVVCHEILYTTEKAKKKFCKYFEEGVTKHLLEIPNQFRLGVALCMECVYYDIYLRRRRFKDSIHEDYHYKYMILSNPVDFICHLLGVLVLVMISMCISSVLGPYLAGIYINNKKNISIRSVISSFSADTWFYIYLCLIGSIVLVVCQDFLVVTTTVTIATFEVPIIFLIQSIIILFFVTYPAMVNCGMLYIGRRKAIKHK